MRSFCSWVCATRRSCDRPSRRRFSWIFCFQVNAWRVPKFQVATACFLCSLRYFSSSKLSSIAVNAIKIIVSKLYVDTNSEKQNSAAPASYNHPNIFIFTLFFSRLRHYATSRKVAGSYPDEVIGFFDWPNPSSRTMGLGSTQTLTEMSTNNLPGGKEWPASKADNLNAICEPIV
jgi:hypothetical protein